LEAGFRLLVIGHRGYVLHRDGAIVLLAATDEAAARLLLWAALAAVPEGTEARLFWIAAGQDWAVEIVLAAGLAVSPAGPICVRGFDPMPYYLPNGAFL
jgi:hypothetical protein